MAGPWFEIRYYFTYVFSLFKQIFKGIEYIKIVNDKETFPRWKPEVSTDSQNYQEPKPLKFIETDARRRFFVQTGKEPYFVVYIESSSRFEDAERKLFGNIETNIGRNWQSICVIVMPCAKEDIRNENLKRILRKAKHVVWEKETGGGQFPMSPDDKIREEERNIKNHIKQTKRMRLALCSFFICSISVAIVLSCFPLAVHYATNMATNMAMLFYNDVITNLNETVNPNETYL